MAANQDFEHNPVRLIKNNYNPSDHFSSHFLFKALIVIIFLFLVPLQAPGFVENSMFDRGWELLHLVLAGIAVSYGLFSKKNDDSGCDGDSRGDNGQSCVSSLLHRVDAFDEGEIQDSSSVCCRQGFDVGGVTDSENGFDGNALILPLRALKSQVANRVDDRLDDMDDPRVSRALKRFGSSPVSGYWCKKGSYGEVSSHGRNGEVFRHYAYDDIQVSSDGFVSGALEERFLRKDGNGSVRSHNADEFGHVDEDLRLSVPSIHRSRSKGSLVKVLADSETTDGKFGASKGEMARDRTEGSVLHSSQTISRSRSNMVERKRDARGLGSKRLLRSQGSQFATSESTGISLHKPPLVKALQKNLRPVDWSESQDYDQGSNVEVLYTGSMQAEAKTRSRNGGVLSVRTKTASDVIAAPMTTSESRESGSRMMEDMRLTRANIMNKPDRNSSRALSALDYPKGKRWFLDQVAEVTNEDDLDDPRRSETDNVHRRILGRQTYAEMAADDGSWNAITDEGPDVDQKADEFIAKFKEQIRQQRIESFKRSTGLGWRLSSSTKTSLSFDSIHGMLAASRI
ncbi:hypothetical protein Droror1_Dr00005078 [Drosera rotundifolia]